MNLRGLLSGTVPSMRFAWFAFGGALASLCGQPLADHHQHLLRSAVAPPAGFALDAEGLIAQMDQADIRRAAIFSIAYQFGNPNRPVVESEADRVRAENAWTYEQAAKYPSRLTAFCSVNPLKDYAMAEIARCQTGLRLHFGNSDVHLENPEHVERLRTVFEQANRRQLAAPIARRSRVGSSSGSCR
jgi:predicted TIM-barrel fold metal-dependent hydrolase